MHPQTYSTSLLTQLKPKFNKTKYKNFTKKTINNRTIQPAAYKVTQTLEASRSILFDVNDLSYVFHKCSYIKI